MDYDTSAWRFLGFVDRHGQIALLQLGELQVKADISLFIKSKTLGKSSFVMGSSQGHLERP